MSPPESTAFSPAVFRRELRASRRSLPWWSLAMAFIVAAGMAKYDALSGSGESLTELFAKLPRAIQALAGFGAFDLTTARGFYAVLLPYLSLLLGIHAAMLGADTVVKEQRDRTAEFLYSKPVSRTAVLTAKLLAALASCAVLWAVTLVASLATVTAYAEGDPVSGEITLLVSSLALVQLAFLAVGAGAAGLCRSYRAAPAVATSVLLATLLLSFAIEFQEGWDWLRLLTPFQYANPRTILPVGHVELLPLAATAVLVAAGVTSLLLGYRTRDL